MARRKDSPPSNRGVVIRLPRAAAILVAALLIIGALWLGSLLEGSFSDSPLSYFFGGLLSFFAVLLAGFSIVALRKKRAVSRWVPAVATVVESGVVWGSGTKGGRTLRLRLAYEYAAGGRVYRAGRVAFYRHCTGSYAQELAARHPAGSQVQVYYDPAEPAEAVMDRSFRAVWLLPFFAVVCAALAFVFFKFPALVAR
ncbi:MAG TPA: DUF3592 domain-containing protein [Pyrinomonadaceae bacterium]|nr:DUF3592 domain-containing protein [Pyrinomonadaceae bacterium]